MGEEKEKKESIWVPLARGIGVVLILVAIGIIILGFSIHSSGGFGDYLGDYARFYLFIFFASPAFIIGIILIIASLRRKK